MTAQSAHPILRAIPFSQIEGWPDDDHQAALETFRRSYVEMKTTAHGFKRHALFGGMLGDWCEAGEAALQSTNARLFFETCFAAYEVKDPVKPEGLFTGYYEPVAEGRPQQEPGFEVPIYSKPPELMAFDLADQELTGLHYGHMENGKASAYFTRQQIEQGALAHRGLELVWLKSWVDAFFIHIQGSGRVKLADGSSMRLAYAGKNGHPYVGIGGELLKRGIATPEAMSMQVLRQWMADHPTEARELMWTNTSFIFFRSIEVADPALGALGAQQVNLTPLRSLAIDRAIWMFGTPLWLDTKTPPESPGGEKLFRHLMVAQDTGTAIKGYARGDLYWGWGGDAAQIAGHMKSPGRMIALLPNAVAKKLVALP